MTAKKKVLFIDDETDQILVVQTRLEANGFEVVSATDGETGLQIAFDQRPDLVVVDLLIPKMDGLEVCKRLKQAPETQQIPLVLFSASATKDLQEMCEALGIEAFLRKPYETAELVSTVQRLTQRGG